MKRIFIGLVTAFVAMLALISGSALWFASQSGPAPKADAIMVLGAGMDADGRLHASTLARVETAVKLYHQGAAPKIVMTGGRLRPEGPSAGGRMAKRAIALGVPPQALISETYSLSTLQNALMSKPLIEDAGITSVVLVTDGFHMLRALATMRWVGIRVVGTRAPTAFRSSSGLPSYMVLREVVAWGANLARVPVWHIGGWLGVDDGTRMNWLR
ncbi:YdcF family protein [Halovulum sp. GXIMD14793]